MTDRQYQLEIDFAADSRYRIDGAHVSETVPVMPGEAALGGSVSVQTSSGTVEVTVPAGPQRGRKLRFKGRGIPAHVAGDLYVISDGTRPGVQSARRVTVIWRMR